MSSAAIDTLLSISNISSNFTVSEWKTNLHLLVDLMEKDMTVFEERSSKAATGLDTAFLVVSAAFVFFMQAGFSLVESGSARSTSMKNILLKNVLDFLLGSIAYTGVGFALSYGDTRGNDFVGYDYFALLPSGRFIEEQGWAFFWFQFSFSATTSTIIGGAVAERVKFWVFVCVNIWMQGLVYPVVVHWIWSSKGWMSPFRTPSSLFDVGVIDFAGGSAVHMVGGLSAMTACLLVGPRVGLYDKHGVRHKLEAASVANVFLGVFILWYGWYGFNCGSTLSIVGQTRIAGRVAVTTTIAPATATLTCLLYYRIKNDAYELMPCLNAVVAGLVCITPACHVVDLWAAAIIGATGWAVSSLIAHHLQKRFRYDDPVDAGPIHFGCGTCGMILIGFFAKKEFVDEVYGGDAKAYGLLYGGSIEQLLVQLMGCGVIIVWVWVMVLPLLYHIHKYRGLRVSEDMERRGLDVKHGGVEESDDAKVLEKLQQRTHLLPELAKFDSAHAVLEYLQKLEHDQSNPLSQPDQNLSGHNSAIVDGKHNSKGVSPVPTSSPDSTEDELEGTDTKEEKDKVVRDLAAGAVAPSTPPLPPPPPPIQPKEKGKGKEIELEP